MAHKFFASGFFISIVFFSSQIFADTYTWSLANDEGALISGNFEAPENWTLSDGSVALVAPGESDDVVIPNSASAYTVTVNEKFCINSLAIGTSDAAGKTTMEFANGVTTNEVKGAVIVGSKGILTHLANTSINKQYKLCLKCAEMTIAANGTVHATQKGPWGKKSGFWDKQKFGFNAGASYGGIGGQNSNAGLAGRTCYGSIREPIDLGAAAGKADTSGYKPGGAIYLEVTGTIEVSGTILANSQANSYVNGTGGSIYIKAGSLRGTGTIDASATKVTSSQGAGGGRVSIRLSKDESFDQFAGTILAFGSYAVKNSSKMAGCGTIYQEHAGDAPGEGTLTIDNGPTGAPIGDNAVARFDSSVKDRAQAFGSVVIKRKGYLRLPSGAVLRIKNRLDSKDGLLICDDGSKVEFVGEGDAIIEGKNSFYNLECTVPGKKLIFGTGSSNRTTIKANGYLTIKGTKENPIEIESAQAGVQCEFALQSGVTQDNSDSNIKDLNAKYGGNVSVLDGIGENCENCFLVSSPKPGDVIVWNGASNSNWTEPANWDRQRSPVESDVVIIPEGCENYPIVETDILLNSFTNLAGGCVSFSGANLVITNAFANFGTFNVSIDNLLKFTGDGDQIVDLGNLEYNRITVDKSGGSVNFASGFSADHFIARTSVPISLFFKEGEEVDVDHLVLYGLTGESGAYNNMLTIGSVGTWYLKATNCHHIRGVNLSNCNASRGQVIKLGVFSANVSGNDVTSCDFSETAAAEWIGGGSDFSSTQCWANEIIPESDTQVCICPPQGVTYTLNATAALSTGSLIIGGEGGTVTFKSNFKSEILGGLYILSGASASFGYYNEPNTVAGDVVVGSYGTLTHDGTTSGSTENYKLNFLVTGNATIEENGTVNINSKGFSGDAKSPGHETGLLNGKTVGSAYAGVGVGNANKPYGSILHPFLLGSLGYGVESNGGGAIKLIAEGDVFINGLINANAAVHNYDSGTGGSVWISGASISGKGKISVRAEGKGDYQWRSSGGRIALYQTQKIGWDNYSLTIDTSGYTSGTYYREDASGEGELFIENGHNNSATAYVYIPMGSEPLSDYRKIAITIAGGNTVAITNKTWVAGTRLVIRDLKLTGSNARIDCMGSKIKVMSNNHKNGKDWTGGDYASRLSAGTITLGTGGAILWSQGFSINIR